MNWKNQTEGVGTPWGSQPPNIIVGCGESICKPLNLVEKKPSCFISKCIDCKYKDKCKNKEN